VYDKAFKLEEGVLLYFSGKAFSSNTYLMRLSDEAIVVDCGMPWIANRVLDYLMRDNSKLDYVFLTHDHFDHVMGLSKLKEGMETQIVAHTRSNLGEVKVEDGDIVDLFDGRLSMLIMHTGRHRPEHVWYYEKKNQLLFTGDYPFNIRRLDKARTKFEVEPEIILPGHGQPVQISL
jgi:glyoxylase-like metal-dependent hydrolase (beta-lactamase superfamily II)